MVVHIYLLLYRFTTLTFVLEYNPKSSKSGLSSSECIASPSIEFGFAWSPILSKVLSFGLSSGL